MDTADGVMECEQVPRHPACRGARSWVSKQPARSCRAGGSHALNHRRARLPHADPPWYPGHNRRPAVSPEFVLHSTLR